MHDNHRFVAKFVDAYTKITRKIDIQATNILVATKLAYSTLSVGTNDHVYSVEEYFTPIGISPISRIRARKRRLRNHLSTLPFYRRLSQS